MQLQIRHVLISVFHKDGLEDLLASMKAHDIHIYSTGGTYRHIQDLGYEATKVESLTGYPSILDGRVKTLHPKVFGGLLARSTEDHQGQLTERDIPSFDAVVVDLYPFQKALEDELPHQALIEKIDIGGISLIRAGAKNHERVLTISSRDQYDAFGEILKGGAATDEMTRRRFAGQAFQLSAAYDTAIGHWMSGSDRALRYGENPHQSAFFRGDLDRVVHKLSGKDLSYNNLVDIDAAVWLMKEFEDAPPTFAVIKHTNACGLAQRDTIFDAWKAALAGDPISAFGGILISNRTIDLETAASIDELFYEVLVAPDFSEEALALLRKKPKRIIMRLTAYPNAHFMSKSCLDGEIHQGVDDRKLAMGEEVVMTKRTPTDVELDDLRFAEIAVKHLKSNGIALIKNKQLIGMGCGQTSRIDALGQAISKAGRLEFDTAGAVMASDAFFPFPDCVTLAHKAGITAVVQPGGSIRDQDSTDYCDMHGLAMIKTGLRHFRH